MFRLRKYYNKFQQSDLYIVDLIEDLMEAIKFPSD